MVWAKEKQKEYYQKYRENNKEKLTAYHKKWHEDNADYVIQYRKDNAEHISEVCKLWRDSNKELRAQLWKDWYKKNPRRSAKRRFTNAIKKAGKRKIEWILSLEEYSELIKLPCYYCNNELGEPVVRSVGLDRLDSDKGYELSNCVSSCYICNCMKNAFLSPEETKAVAQAIIAYRKCPIVVSKIKNDVFYYTYSNEELKSFKIRYKGGMRSSKKKEHSWHLSFEEYLSIASNPCYFCHNQLCSPSKHCAGLDRIDSNTGYELDNVISCCWACNSIKNNFLNLDETIVAVNAVLASRSSLSTHFKIGY